MASLYQRGARYYAQFYVDGKRYRFALKTSTKRSAQQLLRRLEIAYEERKWDPTSESPEKVLNPTQPPGTLEEQVAAFLESRSALSPATIKTYRQVLELYLREGARLQSFLAKRHGVTQQKYYRHLRVFYNWLIKQGWIEKNPCDAVAMPRPVKKEAVYFTREEIDWLTRFIQKHAGEREVAYMPAMIELVCQTGLRLKEVCLLRRDWIHRDYIRLPCNEGFRTKNGKEERVYLTEKARRILAILPRQTENVFVCPDRLRVSHRFLYWRRRAGLKKGSFHSLRHTCAAWMAMNGASAYVIKEHLRHSSLTVTERYMHLSRSSHERLVETALLPDSSGR